MKFKDIPQFPFASYRVNVSWSFLPQMLKYYEENYKIELNPPFQRGYIWSEKQKIEFLEYQLKGGFSGKDIFWNHPNWMGHFSDGILQLVDGQQRVKSVLEFLDNKIKVFGLYLNEFEDKLSLIHPDFIFHINNLKTEKEIVEWYIGMNTGGTVHTEKDLKPAYEILKKYIEK